MNNAGIDTFPIPFPSGQGPIITAPTANGMDVYDPDGAGFALSLTQPLSLFWEAEWR